MYIERLHARNIRLLAEQEFSFLNQDGSPRLWTAIVGENGVCKSTLLQAIALSAMGPKLGSALVQDAQRLRNVNSSEAASIDATFLPPPCGAPFVSSLRIEPARFDLTSGEDFSGADRLDAIRGRRETGWFVAGYGVGRFLAEPGETVLPKDPVVDRVRGLFNLRHKMLGINFYSALRDQGLASRYCRILSSVLRAGDSPGERLLPGFQSLDLEPLRRPGPSPMFETSRLRVSVDDRAIELPATWLSDGYQAMLSWVADLLGHAFLEDPEADPWGLQGIVLLDEIDLHLHPTWQRRIIPLLRRVFPKLQFIVNTHSPLVLAGFERDEIILLKMQGGQVVQDPAEIEPGVLTASEILSNFFDVQRAGRPDLVRKERRYVELKALGHPGEREREELRTLERDLGPYITPSTSVETEMLSPEMILKRRKA
ncbi:MAG TPA: AAA family ATPase [Thermoanaerobaculia bacterium]|nr:AAA family ATPase [Thermoanaerobaculia bacterium]